MFAAFILLAASLISPSPGAIGGSASGNAGGIRGMLKLTRHPGFVAFSVFGFAHMLMNGWVGDVIFFGTFPALGIIGGLHQDNRKLRELGDAIASSSDKLVLSGRGSNQRTPALEVQRHAVEDGDWDRCRDGSHRRAFPSVPVRRIADGLTKAAGSARDPYVILSRSEESPGYSWPRRLRSE